MYYIMNLNTGTPTACLLDYNNYEAVVPDVEFELSPTRYRPQNDIVLLNGNNSQSIDCSNNSKPKGKEYISEKIFQAIKSHDLRVARNKRESKSLLSIIRYTIALFLCTLPVIIFALEMIPERCNICLDEVELDTYFAIAASCGGFGALLLSHDLTEYCVARFLGGAVGSLGALFTIWMMLRALPSSNFLNTLFLVVGVLGAMPGFVVFFLVKIISDECWVSHPQDFEDEFSSLTRLMIEEG